MVHTLLLLLPIWGHVADFIVWVFLWYYSQTVCCHYIIGGVPIFRILSAYMCIIILYMYMYAWLHSMLHCECNSYTRIQHSPRPAPGLLLDVLKFHNGSGAVLKCMHSRDQSCYDNILIKGNNIIISGASFRRTVYLMLLLNVYSVFSLASIHKACRPNKPSV